MGEKKRELSRILVDWTAASDGVARACLGGMRQLIRDKAGSAGQGANVIRRTDVIDALDLQGIEDLFPCPASFPDVGKIVLREYINGTLGFIALGQALSKSPKSLMRMLSPEGNPQARNLFEMVAYLQKIEGTVLEVHARDATAA